MRIKVVAVKSLTLVALLCGCGGDGASDLNHEKTDSAGLASEASQLEEKTAELRESIAKTDVRLSAIDAEQAVIASKLQELSTEKDRVERELELARKPQKESTRDVEASERELELQKRFGTALDVYASGDKVGARRLFGEVCESGGSESCYLLARMLYAGEAGPKDLVRSRVLYGKACDAGHPGGCGLLGFMHWAGEGGSKDLKKARALYTRACNARDTMGCFNLGVVVESGQGGPRDRTGARQYYDTACKQGHSRSCFSLGMNLWTGPREFQDRLRARQSLEMACSQGHAEACYRQGTTYMRDANPTTQEEMKVRALFAKACRGGFEICGVTGGWFNEGRGGPPDAAQALEFLELGCKAKEPFACKLAEELKESPIDEQNVSRYISEGGYSAKIVNVEAVSSSIVRVTVDAKGKAGLRHPQSSCLRNEDGTKIRRVKSSEFTVEKPGEFLGTLDYEVEARGDWYFQYSCRDDYTMVGVNW